MVKADAKHDYYADLDLPPNADLETIKRQFRLLAKQFHPDRNPGREIECVPKFQAVQAAHEVLCDPQQKAQYDISRAKYLKKHVPESPAFKRSDANKAPPPSTAYPPQPPRPHNPGVDRAQFATGRAQPTSGSAEKYAAFNRVPPQQWDRAKFEDAQAKAEAFRNIQSMRGQAAQQQRPHPRAPTAPKSGNTASASDFTHLNSPSPGFPGLSRTQSAPRRTGFAPAAAGSDEPQAKSAYNYVHSHRDKSTPNASYPYPPPPPASSSPPPQRPRASGSPLRQTRSSGFDDGLRPRPAFSRSSSRYATSGGEKTDLNGGGLGRSASVRASPVEKSWGAENGPFGTRAQTHADFKRHQAPPPRHHSASPKMRRPEGATFGYSASESSSSEDEPPPFTQRRAKAVPRKSRRDQSTGTAPANEPAFEGQFPRTNYTRIIDESQYQYPPPEARDVPYRKPFDDMTSPFQDITEGMNNTSLRGTNGSPSHNSKYAPPFPTDMPWLFRYSKTGARVRSQSIKGIPAWALPASVYPQSIGHKFPTAQESVGSASSPSFKTVPQSASDVINVHFTDHDSSHATPHDSGSSESRPRPTHSQSTFSASDWGGKFENGENVFRPSERDRKSPTKHSRSRVPQSRPRAQPIDSTDDESDDISPTVPGAGHARPPETHSAKADAFRKGTFSADTWADKMKDSSAASDDTAARRHTHHYPAPSADTTSEAANDEPRSHSVPRPPSTNPDAMDVDSNGNGKSDTVPTISVNGVDATGRRPSASGAPPSPGSGGLDLSDLADTAPLKPSSDGLNSLSADLGGNLPFTSRAADQVEFTTPSGVALKNLHLPRPPKPIIPPSEHGLTQETWSHYGDNIKIYMQGWKLFNNSMIEHFRTRQDQVNQIMYSNWLTAEGDGVHAESVDGLQIKSLPGTGSSDDHDASCVRSGRKAGYMTYMEWLEQDIMCRRYWDLAVEEHRECMEGLGKIRQQVKLIRSQS